MAALQRVAAPGPAHAGLQLLLPGGGDGGGLPLRARGRTRSLQLPLVSADPCRACPRPARDWHWHRADAHAGELRRPCQAPSTPSCRAIPQRGAHGSRALAPAAAVRAPTSVAAASSGGPGRAAVLEGEAVAGTEVVLHELPSGLRLEVLARPGSPASSSTALAPLVFVHGSYHAAWCWAQYWMPFFAARGYDCYAISLLGQGNSDLPPGPVAGTIQSHAADVSDVIRHVVRRPPTLVGHSFGGLIVQAYLSLTNPPPSAPPGSRVDLEPLAGAVLACSVPPSGNKDLVMRFLGTSIVKAIKVTLSLAAKMFATNTGLCRYSFFSDDMPEDEVKRWQPLLGASSKMPLFDLRKLNASLPVPRPPPESNPPLLILGAENDTILDIQALQETSEFFATPYVIVPNIAHDIMLDTRWESAANSLLSWLTREL